MILLFQILFCAFVFFAIAAVFRRKREGLLGPKGTVFWIVFWVAAAVVVVWPQSASLLASTFGIGRGADFIMYASAAILFYLVFKLHVKLESMGRDVTKMVRKNALENGRLKNDKKSGDV